MSQDDLKESQKNVNTRQSIEASQQNIAFHIMIDVIYYRDCIDVADEFVCVQKQKDRFRYWIALLGKADKNLLTKLELSSWCIILPLHWVLR